jgi:hypothetical protein
MRPQPHARRRAVGSGELDRLEVRAVADDRVAGGIGLGPGEGADAVDEPPSRPQELGHAGDDRHLEPSERRQLVAPEPPQELGTAACRADPGARRVDEDAVESAVDGWPAGVLHEHEPAQAEPFEGCPHEPGPGRPHVRRHDDAARRDPAGDVTGLAPRPSAGVEDALPRLRV